MTTEQQPEETQTTKQYGGIRRLGYWLGSIGILAINVVFFILAGQGAPGVALFSSLVVIVLSFVLVVNRLHNIGMSGRWSLLILVPIVNLFIGWRCAICPEGYQDTKKLDKTGRILAGIFIGSLIIVSVAATHLFMRARTTFQQNACINNLRQIESAKDQYSLENGLTNGATITFANIGPDSSRGGFGGLIRVWPVCPASENANAITRTQSLTENDYNIDVIGQNARCRIVPGKHVLR